MFYFVFFIYYLSSKIIIIPILLNINLDLNQQLQTLALAKLLNTLAQIINLTEVNLILKKKDYKRNLIRFSGSRDGKIIFIL